MTLERVVPALTPSRLVYCNLGTSEATLSRLQLVQNAAAWLLTRSKKRDHVIFLALHLYTSSRFILGQTSKSLNLCNCLQISPQSHNNIHLRISHLSWVLFSGALMALRPWHWRTSTVNWKHHEQQQAPKSQETWWLDSNMNTVSIHNSMSRIFWVLTQRPALCCPL